MPTENNAALLRFGKFYPTVKSIEVFMIARLESQFEPYFLRQIYSQKRIVPFS